MDIFGGIDTESLLKSLRDPGTKAEIIRRERIIEVPQEELPLAVKWRESHGLAISIPESKLAEIGWGEGTKIDIFIHENIMVLFPLNGYLKLRKPPKAMRGKELVIPKGQFRDIDAIRNATVENISFDDLTCYHRMVIQFADPIPSAFQH